MSSNVNSENKSNPKLAAFLMNSFVFSIVANYVVAKFIVIHNPELSGIQIVLGRYLMATIVMLLYVRNDLKRIMID